MAKLNRPELAAWYDVAARCVDAALVTGDSIFTPGRAIWTAANLEELHRRFVDGADVGDGGLFSKLETQLADAASDVRQLMAELLFIYYLPVNKSPTPANKRAAIDRVLAATQPRVAMPAEVAGVLDLGVASGGTGYSVQAYYLLSFYLLAAQRALREGVTRRAEIVADPWRLKSMLAEINPFASDAARQMLLYMAHPESFEPIMRKKDRALIAAAFADESEQAIEDEDRRLIAIRARLSNVHGERFSFYAPELRVEWKSEAKESGNKGRTLGLNVRETWRHLFAGNESRKQTDAQLAEFIQTEFPKAAGNVPRDHTEVGVAGVRSWYNRTGGGLGHAPEQRSHRYDERQQIVRSRTKRVDERFEDGHKPSPSKQKKAHLYAAFLAAHPQATLAELHRFIDEHGIGGSRKAIDSAYVYASPAVRMLFDRLNANAPLGTIAGDSVAMQPTPSVAGPRPAGPIADLLFARHNVVLHGPPGTGKTRASLALADAWRAWQGGDSVEQVTFHPSYAYEDFIEGFRPDKAGRFRLRRGAFVRLSGRALADPTRDFLLIIDELNRGDVARIFGELITLIERDKREPRAARRLPYSRRPFYVPSNLYLLATMNTADRSVSLLDVAIRRRFDFVELVPDGDAIARSEEHLHSIGGVDLAALLAAINRRLTRVHVDEDRAIGHAYFLVKADVADPIAALRERLRHEVVPLVQEYCHADRERAADVLGAIVGRDGHLDEPTFRDDGRFVAALAALCGE